MNFAPEGREFTTHPAARADHEPTMSPTGEQQAMMNMKTTTPHAFRANRSIAILGIALLGGVLSVATPADGQTGQMIVSDRDRTLGVNAWGGAVHGAPLKLNTACQANNPDCTWTYRNGMLVSDRDPRLAINAWGGAREGVLLKLHNGCQPSNPDCTWTYRNGMYVSNRDTTLAINAWNGARQGADLVLTKACRADNPDCRWSFAPTRSAPLVGFVDLHTHPLSNLGFGGKLLYGGVDVGSLLPSDPDCHTNVRASSEAQALGHDKSTHGGHDFFTNTCGDEIRKKVIHAFQSSNHGADQSEDALGYPTFTDWPVWDDLTHQKMWVDWIRRAHRGGLRVMVALAVNNKTLGDMTAGPGDFPTDDMSSVDRQITEIKSFVGRHPDFMEVAYTSGDLSRIVSAGKLAVVVGVEVDHLGNLGAAVAPLIPAPAPPDAALTAEIHRLYGEGVRYIFPIHVIDNAFGGAAAYESLFDVSSFRENGRPYSLVCANSGDNIRDAAGGGFTYSNGEWTDVVVNTAVQTLKTGFAIVTINAPTCAAGVGQKNSLGLTPSGTVAIKEMMRLGMLIDIDHMSQAAADATLALATQFGYPVNSGHNGLRGALAKSYNERSLRADQYTKIGVLHGMAGVGSGGLSAGEWLTLYEQVVAAMGGGAIVGAFGTDVNGFALGMRPPCVRPPMTTQTLCPGRQGPPVQYTAAFPASSDGARRWDYNIDGVAHYGMLPDFLKDVATLPGGAALVSNFMTGADYFFKTWQMAEAASARVR